SFRNFCMISSPQSSDGDKSAAERHRLQSMAAIGADCNSWRKDPHTSWVDTGLLADKAECVRGRKYSQRKATEDAAFAAWDFSRRVRTSQRRGGRPHGRYNRFDRR